MGTSSVSPSCPVPRPCTSVDRPCMQAPRGLWDTLRLRRLGRGATLRTGSPQAVSSGRSGLPDENDVRSSSPTYKDARRRSDDPYVSEIAPNPAAPSRDFSALRRIFAFVRPYRLRLAGAILALTVAAATVL